MKREDVVVYKAIGPALVKQEKGEAQSNVEKRIEFINGEISRAEQRLKELETKEASKRQDLISLQQCIMQQQQQQPRPQPV